MTFSNLDKLWTRGKEFLGSEYAILGGAMSWISESQLVSATSNAGGFGVIGSGAMPVDVLAEEIKKTQKLTNKPFGVNLITMRPDLDDLIKVCAEYKVSHVVLAGGLPPAGSIKQIKDYGGKVICFAPALVLAKRLIRNGADALIIEGSEAGGHIGPVVTSILAQEILPVIKEVPIFVAGGIGRGETAVNYLKLGASGVQLGTLLAATEESIAHENFKKAFLKAQARDALSTIQLDPQFPVIPVRTIANKGTQEFLNTQKQAIENFKSGKQTQEEAQLSIERYWVGALKKAVIDGDTENGSVMAGQVIGMVKEVLPISTVINNMCEQAEEFLKGYDK